MSKDKQKKIRIETIEGVPSWAIYYLEYGEDPTLTDEERKMIDGWVEGLREEGYRLIAPIDGTKEDFDNFPAFGLPCTTESYSAEVVGKEEL